jgi:glutaredoxin 3
VFSKSYCPYCARTKQAFADLNVPIKIYELDQIENGEEIQQELLAMTKQRTGNLKRRLCLNSSLICCMPITVPNVFVNGQHIGGNDDTQSAIKSGKIAQLLGIARL